MGENLFSGELGGEFLFVGECLERRPWGHQRPSAAGQGGKNKWEGVDSLRWARTGRQWSMPCTLAPPLLV